MLYEQFEWENDAHTSVPAWYRFCRVGSNFKEGKLLYTIHAPRSLPFFPNDDRLSVFVSGFTELTFIASTRLYDRDMFRVSTTRRNMFNVKADHIGRARRAHFLKGAGSLAFPVRDIPEYVRNACQVFMNQYGYTKLIWNQAPKKQGDMSGGFDLQECGGRWMGSYLVSDPLVEHALQQLAHTCAPYLPFRLEVAQQ